VVAVQITVAAVIFANFITEVVQAQTLRPGAESGVFLDLETAFTIIFTFEVCVNMFANLFTPFLRDPWNWFDMLIIGVSLASMAELSNTTANMPGLTTLRLLRGVRVVRLFTRLKRLKRIVTALYKAVPSMLNAFVIVTMVMALYAIMCVEFFGVHEQELFGTFGDAMFTLFQILTGDGWSDVV